MFQSGDGVGMRQEALFVDAYNDAADLHAFELGLAAVHHVADVRHAMYATAFFQSKPYVVT